MPERIDRRSFDRERAQASREVGSAAVRGGEAPPPTSKKIGEMPPLTYHLHLDSITAVRREMGEVYRMARKGLMAIPDAQALTWLLERIVRTLQAEREEVDIGYDRKIEEAHLILQNIRVMIEARKCDPTMLEELRKLIPSSETLRTYLPGLRSLEAPLSENPIRSPGRSGS